MAPTRRQKAKARKSREIYMMSDFENMDVMLGNDNVNPIELELSNIIGNSEGHCDDESNSQPRENDFVGNDLGHYVRESIIPRQDRFQETMKTFTSEFNVRLSQEMDSSNPRDSEYSQLNVILRKLGH